MNFFLLLKAKKKTIIVKHAYQVMQSAYIVFFLTSNLINTYKYFKNKK